ncbi:molybdopterin biosynthesis protein [Salinarimonas soli]|uniref:Molybdopterin molybdenumtransferase n=1 Tax=Salinarimonas soli TaxID=1638099 RepID=A0A5B2VS82_9HYPH|nr:molybdopterin biosynthesis protein [Salinarimonas soli]KAA2241206.1 molybdopterin biosynthesis protein [Salinarimonas soli]
MSSPPVQDQFLTVLSRDEAVRRFREALDLSPRGIETVPLGQALGRVLSADVASPIDVPPFDRSGVDGFAVRAADLAAASEPVPVTLRLNPETIACGVSPGIALAPGTATPIATGGPIPRGADAVVMIEHTEPVAEGIAVRRAPSPGAFIGFAGSDIARGEVLLRRGTLIGSREIGMLAACGLAEVSAIRRPRVGILSTGDELVAPGQPLRPAAIYDSNGPIVAAAVAENGGDPVAFGAFPDDAALLEAAIRRAFAECDMVVLSGGTSKGAGDLTYRLVADLGAPGIVAHGVALKPGKPLCLAVCDGKPVVVLPGFPTSAMFTFHDIVAPVLRRLSGLPERTEASMPARVPVRVASELGRTEFVMVSLVDTPDGPAAYPTGKGSGAVTSFAQADGFLTVEALADSLPAGATAPVTLFTPHLRVPDLVIVGSHDPGLDAVTGHLAERGVSSRVLAVGSLGGLAAARRGECDLAPIHLMDPKTGLYNEGYLQAGLELVPGWRRMQGIVFRAGDTRFEGRTAEAAVAAALADPACLMVNRNSGAGTRLLIDRLLGGARPEGYWNQPRSHNAVAAGVAQGRADWGIAIAPVASAYGLSFIPVGEEHFDFALVAARRNRPPVAAFLEALADRAVRDALEGLGFRPA